MAIWAGIRHVAATMLVAALAGAIPAHAATPGFCLLSVEETAGTLAILTPQGNVLKRLTLGERPHEIAVAPDGRTAFVSMFGITDYDSRIGTAGDRVARIDLRSGTRVGDYVLPDGVRGPHGVKLRPPQLRELFVNAESGGDTMLVFDVASKRLLRRFALPPATHNFVFSEDGATLFSFAGAKGATRIDPATGRVLAARDAGTPVRGLLATPDGNVLASARGEILLLRGSDLSVAKRVKAPRDGQFVYLDLLPDGTIAAPSLDDGGVALIPADGSPARFTATGKTPILARLGPDGLIYVANVQDDHITVLGADGAVVRTISGLTTPNGIGFGTCPRR